MNIRLENLIKIYSISYLCNLEEKELLKIKGMTNRCKRDILKYKKKYYK